MNQQLKKQLNAYKRTLEDRKLQSSIYTALIILTVLFFDAFGIYSMVKITKRRYQTTQQLQKLNDSLTYKKDQIDLLKKKLKDSQVYLDMLEKAVPTTPLVEDYMVSLVRTGAKYGYKQDELIRRRMEDNYVKLRASFEGQKTQMPNFVKAVESLDRLAVIEDLHYTIVEDTVKLELVIDIYFMNR